MSFWNDADLAFQRELEDSINDEIWSQSVKIHEKKGFTRTELAACGYGAQQAMLPADASVLPWVPDVLGSEWDHPQAVHIVGIAYAGFIKEISERCFPLEEYVKASKGGWRDFARTYLSLVIRGDQAYYEPLCPVLEYFGSKSRFCLFDLCRASLVKREVNRPRDKPISPSKADQLSQQCVASYCEHCQSQRWTFDRLRGGLSREAKSPTRAVIALGLTAEHGLLKLFLKSKQYVWDSSEKRKPWLDQSKNSASPLWTVHYARSGSTLGKRLQSPTWWCVGPSLHEARWHVIPIYHPSFVSRHDPAYERTLKILLPAAAPVS
ncbi:MAG TPA: hypothetical protein VK419_15575 [Bryobacteraceae bacterium]|nr:hypothetical protein [Bryobacteraceae bacterium]